MRITLLHRLPGPLQTMRQICPEVMRSDTPGQGDVVGATAGLHTLQEPQGPLVIVERARLEVVRVTRQPGQNFRTAHVQLTLQLGTQSLRQARGNHQAAFARGQADTAQPAVMHQAIEHVSSFIVRIRGQPPWQWLRGLFSVRRPRRAQPWPPPPCVPPERWSGHGRPACCRASAHRPPARGS
ncbi:hypothetical protein [Pseudomonas sp. 34 E 7]|nr:hypothetical protein [Pseudomonas sp. 34 E 7]